VQSSRTAFTVPSYPPRRLACVRRLALASIAAVIVLAPLQAQAAPQADPGVFAGLGTWFDVYDGPSYRSPAAAAARVAGHGVHTVYVETANDRSATDVVNAPALGAFVDALHSAGVEVVGWYLPGFAQPAVDLRRTRAMLGFRTPAGAGFDGVALDIESLRLKSIGLRTTRLLALSRTLRTEAGDTPVAAISYAPRGLERHPAVWPRFPWQQITPLVDAWIPMTYTGGGLHGYDATYGYVARSLRLLRAAVGPMIPIHAAGGVANRMTAEELKAFTDAVADDGTVTGWSLYDFPTTGSKAWAALTQLAAG
jgi:hypothetical protein